MHRSTLGGISVLHSGNPSPGQTVRFLHSHAPSEYPGAMVMFRPLNYECDLCSIPLDAVMKVETFKADLQLVSDILGLGLQVHLFKLLTQNILSAVLTCSYLTFCVCLPH